jgi:hypothetical protein
MAEQSTSSSLAWISWNETFFFAGSWKGTGGFAGGGQASLDPNPNLQFLAEGATWQHCAIQALKAVFCSSEYSE